MTLLRWNLAPAATPAVSDAEKRRQEAESRYWQERADAAAKRAGLQLRERG